MPSKHIAPEQPRTEPASSNKDIVRALQDFTMDELDQIPVVRPGERLLPRAVYVDLRDPRRREMIAYGDAVAGGDALLVPKAGVAHEHWERLTAAGPGGAPTPGHESNTRYIEQGENELRGGHERSERRGAGAVRSTPAARRH